jgi:PAS domain S-box-containing protein
LGTEKAIFTLATPDEALRKGQVYADTAVLDEREQADELLPEQPDSIAALQVSQCIRALPLLLFFHASAALSLSNLTGFQTGHPALYIWLGFAGLAGLLLAGFYVIWRSGRWHSRPARVLHGLEVMGLVLGLVWVTPIAVLTRLEPGTDVITVAGVTLAVLSIGVVSLIRVPTGAVVFISLVSAALAASLYQALQQNKAMAALLCVIYCLVLIGVTLNSHIDFRRRSKAELDVKHQNDVIKLLLNDFEREASDWLWETDLEGRLVYVSPRLEEVLGRAASTLQDQPLQDIFRDYATLVECEKLRQAVATLEPFSNLEMELKFADKPCWWQFTAQPLLKADGTVRGIRGVCRDVTLAREAQRRLEAAMEASERASAAKTQFLAVMSHELRTPINSIVGFSEMLVGDKSGTLDLATRAEFSETVLESARHLQSLINDLLDATRMERGSFQLNEQDADAAELVEIAIKLCREQADRAGVSIVGRLTDGITLEGDVTRLKQVIINLLTNAVKFSPQGGIVNVEMQRGSGSQFVLAIKDAGIGISTEDMEKVFDPFVQADAGLTRRFGGVGLGLPIARRIARLHDGDVTLESLEGAGTTALLVLPKQRVTWPRLGETPVSHVA